MKKTCASVTNSRRYRGCFLILICVVIASMLYFQTQTPQTATAVVKHFGAESASKCWKDPKPFLKFEPDESVLRNSTGNEDNSICKRQKRLLPESLAPKCNYGNEVLDAGDCVMQGPKIVRCLPSFVIAGAMKSGTGALLRWLKRHPHLEAGKGPTGQNEMHFFGEKYAEASCPWSAYLELFPPMTKLKARKTYTFDKSPDYMRDLTKLQQLHTTAPSARIIVILRNPTSRAYSGFFHNCRHGRFYRLQEDLSNSDSLSLSLSPSVSLSAQIETKLGAPKGLVGRVEASYAPEGSLFHNGESAAYLEQIDKGDCTAVDFHRYVYGDDPKHPSSNITGLDYARNSYLDMYIGHYDEQIANIYSLFPPERVLVLFQEHMDRGTIPTLRRIEKFLGLPKVDYGDKNFLVTRNGDEGISYVWNEYRKTHLQQTSATQSKSNGMFPVTKSRLDEYYSEHNSKLRDMLERHGALSKEFPFPSTWPLKQKTQQQQLRRRKLRVAVGERKFKNTTAGSLAS